MAEGNLRINMVTPRGPVADASTDAITAPGELGEFEILPGHVPFLTALHAGVLVLGERSQKQIFAVGRGYLRIDRDGEVEVLVEKAVAGDKVDITAAREQLQDTERELEGWKDKMQDGDWRNVKDRFDWAQAQIDAYERT